MKKLTLSTLFVLCTYFLAAQLNITVQKEGLRQIKSDSRSFYLPFFEDWSSGSIETNNWTAETENWKINNQVGNERPSIEFDWSPLLEDDYSASLESDEFNGEFYKVGKIFLEFELKLFDRNSTGDEKILVEVFDGEDWNQVAEYSNEGSFEWLCQIVEITDYALGNDFKIRFNAIGQNSYDVIGWYVDNIALYRSCDPPFDLFGSIYWHDEDDKGVELWWTAPESVVFEEFEWLNWDDGIFDQGLGIAGTGDFTAAARWISPYIESYLGDTINTIRFYVADSGFAELELKIWTGEDGVDLIYQKAISDPGFNSWNTLVLDSVLIIENTDYWVGLSVVGQEAGHEPIGSDNGPAVNGANYVSDTPGEWYALEDLEINRNINIQMKLMNGDTISGGCIGFNIYRQDKDSYPDFVLLDFVEFEEQQNLYSYSDVFDFELAYVDNCYKVNALWGNETDTCVSNYAIAKFAPFYDVVCFLYASFKENHNIELKLFPNPTTNEITISSTENINRLMVMNGSGKVFLTRDVLNAKEYTIDVSSLPPGLYIVELMSDSGIRKGKIIKNR